MFASSNDRLLGGDGDDAFFVTNGGNNLFTGDAGSDVFWVLTGELPDAANIVADFEIGVDHIAIGGMADISSIDNLNFSQVANDIVITVEDQEIAVIQDTVISEVQTDDNFIFA